MPMLMRPLALAFGMHDRLASRDRQMLRALWAGVVISLAAFLWALVYVARLGREVLGADRAADAALLLASYPFALFFSAPYTESLFLLAAVGAFFHFRRGDWVAASCWGLVAGLTRPNGCLLSVPLGILALEQIYSRLWRYAQGSSDARRRGALRLLTAAMPGIGMLVFTGYLYGLTGVWFAWARSHEAWGRTYQGWGPFVTAFGWLRDEPLLQVVTNIPVQHAQRARRVVRPRAHVSGVPAVRRRLRRLRAHQPRAAPFCGWRAVDGTSLLDALPAVSGARGRRPAAERSRLGGRFRDRTGAVRRPVLHVARAVLTDPHKLCPARGRLTL